MRVPRRRQCWAGVVGSALLTWTGPAPAQETERCVEAYELAQEQLQQERLLAAREQLAVCIASCPEVLTGDCAEWLRSLPERIPVLTVAVHDGAGQEVTPRELWVDGRRIPSEELRVEVDPGEHHLEARGANGAVGRLTTSVRAGEQRAVVLVLEVIAEAPPRERASPESAAPPPARETAAARRRFPAGPVLLGSAGLAALGVGLTLDLTAHAKAEHLQRTCKPSCDEADVTAVRRQLLVGDALLGLGAASVGAATWWWWARVHAAPAEPRRGALVLSPAAQGVGLAVGTAF